MSGNDREVRPTRLGVISGTLISLLLAVVFGVMGCGLVFGGFSMIMGAFFHEPVALAAIVLVLSGFVSLMAAWIFCAVPILLIGRRRERLWWSEARRRAKLNDQTAGQRP